MNKKILIIILTFISLFNISFGGFYNASYTDLYLEIDGWCTGIEIPFKLYNVTDYNNKEEIKSDLCDPDLKCRENECMLEKNWRDDDCDDCGNCVYFQEMKDHKVKIYSGPMDSLPILTEITTNIDGEFTYTFNKANQYLIEVISEEDKNGNKEHKYNDYEVTIDVFDCPGSQKNNEENETSTNNTQENQNNETQIDQKPENTLLNQTFDYIENQITLEIQNTNIINQTEIIINENIEISNKPENSKKLFQIDSANTNFENITVKTQYLKLNPESNISVEKFNSADNQWEKIEFNEENEQISFSTNNFGIYSISEFEPIIEEKQSLEESIENGNTEIIENTNNENSKSSSTTKYILIGVAILVLIIIGIIVIKKKTGINSYKGPEDRTNQVPIQKEILTTYEQTYQKTKDYVQKYKNDYSKDQIYRALEKAEIPRDIIDKVLKEELL